MLFSEAHAFHEGCAAQQMASFCIRNTCMLFLYNSTHLKNIPERYQVCINAILTSLQFNSSSCLQ